MGVIPSAGSAVSAVSVSPNNAIRASTAALVLQLVAHFFVAKLSCMAAIVHVLASKD